MSRFRIIVVCLIWLAVFGFAVGLYKWIWAPISKSKQEVAAKQQAEQKIYATSSDAAYKHNITFALDGFSGYAVIRSSEFTNLLRQKSIKINLVDDGADYDARLNAIRAGDVQMGVFTLDSLIKASAKMGDIPATAVCLIDETRGADAMMSYKQTIPNVDALNDPETKFVLTPNSPSEMLAQVVIANFNLNRLGPDPFVRVAGAEEVYRQYRQSRPNSKQVFIVWEPFASKMEENPNIHRVIDSGRFRGYIVDVIVASRDFIIKEPDVVRDVIEAYLRATYSHKDRMVALVLEDAKKTGATLTEKQAEKLVKGIWWKNTQENYIQMGLGTGPLQHVEDMLINMTSILQKNGVSDPTAGKPNLLYYNKALGELHNANFHPGSTPDSVREDSILPVLSDSEWSSLIPLGTLKVEQLIFARGTARLSERSNAAMDDLIEKLKSLPTYYCFVQGDASRQGDIEANKELALQRAQAAADYLTSHGVHPNRVKAVAVEPTGNTAVNFVLGQTPY